MKAKVLKEKIQQNRKIQKKYKGIFIIQFLVCFSFSTECGCPFNLNTMLSAVASLVLTSASLTTPF